MFCTGRQVAAVLAELGDSSGYELATELAAGGSTHGQRWRAVVVLAHIANTDKANVMRWIGFVAHEFAVIHGNWRGVPMFDR